MIYRIISLVHQFEFQLFRPHIFNKSHEASSQVQWQSKPLELQEPLLAVTKTLGFSHIRPSRGKW